jgi:hypothetical protein
MMHNHITPQELRVHLLKLLECMYTLQTQHAQSRVKDNQASRERASDTLDGFYITYARLWQKLFGDESLPLHWHIHPSAQATAREQAGSRDCLPAHGQEKRPRMMNGQNEKNIPASLLRMQLERLLESMYLLHTQHAQLMGAPDQWSDEAKARGEGATDTFYLAYARLWSLLFQDETLPLLWHTRTTTVRTGETDPLIPVPPLQSEIALIVTWLCPCGTTNQWMDSERTRIIECQCGRNVRIEGWIGYNVCPVLVQAGERHTHMT